MACRATSTVAAPAKRAGPGRPHHTPPAIVSCENQRCVAVVLHLKAPEEETPAASWAPLWSPTGGPNRRWSQTGGSREMRSRRGMVLIDKTPPKKTIQIGFTLQEGGVLFISTPKTGCSWDAMLFDFCNRRRGVLR